MKALTIIGVIAATVVVYIFMLAMQGTTNELVATANATGNWAGHPDFALGQGVMNSYPLWQWFLPATMCFILIAVVAKGRD